MVNPDDTPVTIPVADPTVAMVVLPLLHLPPPASVRVVVWPTHTLVSPVMGNGNGFTVSVTVAEHPVLMVYDIIVVPVSTPVASPVPGFIVATLVFELVQVPPAVASLNAVVKPAQTIGKPVIAEGVGFTVTVVTA